MFTESHVPSKRQETKLVFFNLDPHISVNICKKNHVNYIWDQTTNLTSTTPVPKLTNSKLLAHHGGWIAIHLLSNQ